MKTRGVVAVALALLALVATASAAAILAPGRTRVTDGPVPLAPPVWQDDPDFDLDYHVRRVALPSPGDRAELFELARRFVQDPLDRRRPLWQYLIVEGVDGTVVVLTGAFFRPGDGARGGIETGCAGQQHQRNSRRARAEPCGVRHQRNQYGRAAALCIE